ncbi:MAG: ATP-binding protein [Bacteroidales bacterium]|nr:ATP-binding protein [Bacteroidales bacterium]MBN2756615.1 ATP-binding protein [Bacteroidales bacterium]
MQKVKIIITGPESTGKTTLAKQLAEHYKTIWLPEYARTYVENLNRPYNYNDIEKIAEKQILLEEEYFKNANKILFVDTGLIITKIWFTQVFKKYPSWLDNSIKTQKPDLYLLCNYDLPWISDSVRENGSDNKRQYLFRLYQKEIEKNKFKYKIISKLGKERLNSAIKIIDKIIY